MKQREANQHIRNALKAIDELGRIPVGKMKYEISDIVFGIYERGKKLNTLAKENKLIKRDIIRNYDELRRINSSNKGTI
jgi:hypothetical protein